MSELINIKALRAAALYADVKHTGALRYVVDYGNGLYVATESHHMAIVANGGHAPADVVAAVKSSEIVRMIPAELVARAHKMIGTSRGPTVLTSSDGGEATRTLIIEHAGAQVSDRDGFGLYDYPNVANLFGVYEPDGLASAVHMNPSLVATTCKATAMLFGKTHPLTFHGGETHRKPMFMSATDRDVTLVVLQMPVRKGGGDDRNAWTGQPNTMAVAS